MPGPISVFGNRTVKRGTYGVARRDQSILFNSVEVVFDGQTDYVSVGIGRVEKV